MNRTTIIIALVGILLGSALFGIASTYAVGINGGSSATFVGCDLAGFPEVVESCESRARLIGARNGVAQARQGQVNR